MHPTSVFQWNDQAAMLAFLGRSFATLVDSSLRVAQAPLLVDGDRLLLHLARTNPIAKAMPTRVVAIQTGDDGYISPDWYASEHQVPTWNYESVEIEGMLTPTDEETLRYTLDRLIAIHEAWVVGKTPWTTARLPPGELEKHLKNIVGASLTIESIRGTQKLSQNKPLADRDGIVKELVRSPEQKDRGLAVRMVIAKRPAG